MVVRVFPDRADLVEIFEVQLEREKLVLDLHQQSADLVTITGLRYQFEEIAREEEFHIKTAEKILRRLKETAN